MEKQIFLSISAEELVNAIKDGVQEVLKKESSNSSKSENEEDLLNIEDVQKIFRVSKVTIHKWKKAGLLPYYKVNRKLYFKKSEVINSLEHKKRKWEGR